MDNASETPTGGSSSSVSTSTNVAESAVAKVFAIPELLEVILIDQSDTTRDAKRLFVLQRINKAFRDTISGSVKLRRMMFLEDILAGGSDDCIFNPFCCEFYQGLLDGPLVLDLSTIKKDLEFPNAPVVKVVVRFPPTHLEDYAVPAQVTRQGDSWRKMLLSQNAASKLLRLQIWNNHGEMIYRTHVYSLVNLGELVDGVFALALAELP